MVNEDLAYFSYNHADTFYEATFSATRHDFRYYLEPTAAMDKIDETKWLLKIKIVANAGYYISDFSEYILSSLENVVDDFGKAERNIIIYDCANFRLFMSRGLDFNVEFGDGNELKNWVDWAVGKFKNEDDVNGSSAETAFEISNAAELALMAKEVNSGVHATSYFKLTDDIMLGAHPWTAIGKSSIPFRGYFNGCGHAIYGLNIDTDQDNQGLFGNVSGGSIKNLNLKSGIIKSTGSYIGSVVGYVDIDRALKVKVTIENVTSDIEVHGHDYVGGLVGENAGTISMCNYFGYVYGEGITGGIAGDDAQGDILKCTANCYVSGESKGAIVGALVGNHRNGTIENCFARGTINGEGKVLAGNVRGGPVTACYFYGTSTQSESTLHTRMSACYAVVNKQILTTDDFDIVDWTQYWAVVPGLNNGLPVQKELFWVGAHGSSALEDIKRALSNE